MSATQQNIEELQLQPINFDMFARENSLFKKQYKLTKHNPFKSMSDSDWKLYVETHEPHFTSEPYYELIPWQILQQLEVDAKAAGWELILRTTNNTAYCPGHVGQDWCQRTQWIFGLPNQQFLIHLTYNEDKWSLVKDDKNLQLMNYFHLEVVATTKLKAREKTKEELEDEFYDLYDYQGNYSSKIEYYEPPNPPKGWVRNGGMTHQGTSQFNYIFVGYNAKYNPFLGTYTSAENTRDSADDDDSNEPRNNEPKKNENEKEEKNKLEKMITSSFWVEWIENNKDDIVPGKFDELQITDWSDTFVLPGEEFNLDEILRWNMDFQFLQKFIKSNISKWITREFGYDCCGTIGHSYWNIKLLGCLSDNPQLFKKTCILEAKIPGKSDDDWIPFDGYRDSLFKFESIRLSENAKKLIKQVWEYVKLQNQ